MLAIGRAGPAGRAIAARAYAPAGPYPAVVIDLFGTAAGAAVVFAATDIDDIVILTLFFVTARSTGRPRPWQIVAGQYLGIGALALASAVVAAGLLVVPDPWTGLLGLLPIALGVRALLRLRRRRGAGRGDRHARGGRRDDRNGADNVAVYVPVFRALGPADSAVFLLIFVAARRALVRRPPPGWAATPGWSGWSSAPATGWYRRSSSASALVILVGSGVVGRLIDLAG